MRRGFILVALVVTFVSQFLAIGAGADTRQQGADESHAMLHWKGEAHHHLDDGSLQHDESEDSTQHLLVDHVLAAPWLVSTRLAALPLVIGECPLSLAGPSIPDPYLPGLRRPPRG